MSASCKLLDKRRWLTLSLERVVDVPEHLHRVRATALLLSVVKNVALLGNRAVDHVEEDRAERLLHVRTDPDEEPVVELDAGGEDGADARAGADGDAAAVEMSEVGETGKLRKNAYACQRVYRCARRG